MDKIQKRIFEIIEPAKRQDSASRFFDLFIILLIILNIVAVILGSFSDLNKKIGVFLDIFEAISIAVFTIEYFLRILTARFRKMKRNAIASTFRYAITPMAVIDLLAILPFYIPFLLAVDLRFLRILRLTRLLRILKINRYSKSLQLLGKVLSNKKEELIVTIFVTLLLMLLAASIMFYLETNDQPQSFPNILASFWWAIATLTTVGYGDVYPVTILGKILAGVIAFLGIGLVALPTGIISTGFLEEYSKGRKSRNKKKMKKNTSAKEYRKRKLERKKRIETV